MTRRFLVTGRVQGVGFRYFVRREARRLGLNGWVRNLPDGEVEVLASGTAAALAVLEAALRRGPPMASVTNVQSLENMDETDPSSGFFIAD